MGTSWERGPLELVAADCPGSWKWVQLTNTPADKEAWRAPSAFTRGHAHGIHTHALGCAQIPMGHRKVQSEHPTDVQACTASVPASPGSVSFLPKCTFEFWSKNQASPSPGVAFGRTHVPSSLWTQRI